VRGHFGIGIYHSEYVVNVGTLWRSAHVLGANYLFTIGKRWPHQASDTTKAWKHIPLFEFLTFEDFREHLPYGTRIVAVELDDAALPIANYCHPERCAYLLGAEDHGIPADVLSRCDEIVQLPGAYCLNVAVAGSLVMYDRLSKAAKP